MRSFRISSGDSDNHGDSTRAWRVVSRIVGPSGNAVTTVTASPISIPAWGRREFEQQVVVNGPALRSIEAPNLYRLFTTVEGAGAAVDHYEMSFGIRSLRFDAEKGFFLIDMPVKIKGTCNHRDHGGVASALPNRGKLLGVGNGDPSSHESDKRDQRRACNGLAMAIVQAGKQAGEMRVEAFSPGLESVAVTVTCEPAQPRPAVA
jgi:beta-galactosidase